MQTPFTSRLEELEREIKATPVTADASWFIQELGRLAALERMWVDQMAHATRYEEKRDVDARMEGVAAVLHAVIAKIEMLEEEK